VALLNLVDRAAAMAMRAHHGQVNKHDDEPYILHPHRVMVRARERGLSEVHQAVAWLHDTVEDTPLTTEEIMAELGAEIAENVMLLTKTKGVSNEQYYGLLCCYPIAARIKVCDIHDNFSRNHLITDGHTRLRMATKYSMGLDILGKFA
jgi:hypothetical protein